MTASSSRRPQPYRPDHLDGVWSVPRIGSGSRPSVPRPATLLAVDVTGFGGHRTAAAQVAVRRRLYEHLTEAFEMTRLPWWESHREDRGDGVLLVSPSDAQPALFLDPLAHHLKILLRQADRHDAPPLRLRMAVHHGNVHYDAYGVTGGDLVLLCRLLDAPAFKRALNRADARPPAGLGVIVSDHLFEKTARTSPYVDPDAYRRIDVSLKELRHGSAWLWTA